MKTLLLAAAPALLLIIDVATGVPASARGFDVGPLGQCFNQPDCGGRQRAYAYQCPMVRQRIETPSGRVVYRMRHVCR